LAIRLRGRVREHREFMTAMVLFPEDSLRSAKASAGAMIPGGGIEIKVDVASARLEFYDRPGAMPQVERSSIKMDLYRRDFSINAMAVRLDPDSFGQLVDFFDGQNDIRGKRIRVLHALSFVEDPTRMFRAVRFEQRYGFRLGGQCEKFMRNAVDDLHLIEGLAGARITHELELVMKEKFRCEMLVRLDELGLLSAVHPMLALSEEKREMAERVGKVLEWYMCMYLPEKPDMLMVMLIALCRRSPAPEIEALLSRLQLLEKRVRDTMAVRGAIMSVRQSMEKWARSDGPMSVLHSILRKAPLETLLYLLAMEERPEPHEKLTRYIYMGRTMRANITGDDIIALGVGRGAEVGRILDAVVSAKMDSPDLDREGQLEIARRLAEEAARGAAS
ncbi:MAG: polya polymerase, partial [Mailhella sp.]|nr:polya polymerase [Mailhella sp.]